MDDASSTETSSATTTTARSAPVGHGYSKLIIEKLRDEDFVMETPSAAIFTLIVGEGRMMIASSNQRGLKYL